MSCGTLPVSAAKTRNGVIIATFWENIGLDCLLMRQNDTHIVSLCVEPFKSTARIQPPYRGIDMYGSIDFIGNGSNSGDTSMTAERALFVPRA